MGAAEAYHAATKYAPETLAQQGGLDWSAQPIPYRRYEDSVQHLELGGYLPLEPNPFTGRPADPLLTGEAAPLGIATVARWLYFTYGVTAVMPQQPRPLYLRASPSAGGLYPTELYLIVRRDLDGLPAGLWGFDPIGHRLAALRPGADTATALDAACYGNAAVAAAPLALVASGVFQRSAWRYAERGYRRVLLDTGHVLGNAALVAASLGLRTHLTAAFCDRKLNAAIGAEPEAEGALAVLAANVPGPAERPTWTALPSGSDDPRSGEGPTRALHRASALGPQRPRLVARGEEQGEERERRYATAGGVDLVYESEVPLARDLAGTILRRRSTRRYRRGGIPLAGLTRILAAAYEPEAVGLGAQPALDRSQLLSFIAVADVAGLASGVYYFAPHARQLRLLKAGLNRNAVQYLCLGQDLGGDAFATVIHTADLPRAVTAQGDRAYRHLHLDAGLIGQRLNLAALAEGVGASGIGGFFDDHVNALLGIPEEQAVVYITTLGLPKVQSDSEEDEE